MKKNFKGMTLIEVIVIIAIVLVVALAIGTPFIERAIAEDTVTVTVTDKNIKRYDESDKYLIYTNNGTYEITDTIAYWRWDSSDLYGEIEIGETYEMKVCGFRIPFFSMYENIIEVEKTSN